MPAKISKTLGYGYSRRTLGCVEIIQLRPLSQEACSNYDLLRTSMGDGGMWSGHWFVRDQFMQLASRVRD